MKSVRSTVSVVAAHVLGTIRFIQAGYADDGNLSCCTDQGREYCTVGTGCCK